MHITEGYRRRRGRLDGPYWSLRKSYEAEDGKRRFTHAAYLGKAPSRLAAYDLARKRGYLCGAYGCYQAPKARLAEGDSNLALCEDHLHERVCGQDVSLAVPLVMSR
jgi:hypothetical protein